MASRHLAIDIGASSGRAIVGELDETGRLRLTEVHRFENGLVQRAGHLCWDIDALWESVLHGLTAAHEQGLTPATVGIDTWGVDFVLLDAQDRRIGEAVGYRDARTQGVREELERTGVLPFSEHYARAYSTNRSTRPTSSAPSSTSTQSSLPPPTPSSWCPTTPTSCSAARRPTSTQCIHNRAGGGHVARLGPRLLARLGLPETLPACLHAGLLAGSPASRGRPPRGL